MQTQGIVYFVGASFLRTPRLGFASCFKSNLNTYLHKCVIMALAAGEGKKSVWMWTKSKDVMTASIERGWDTFIFTPATQHLCEEWKCKLIYQLHPALFIVLESKVVFAAKTFVIVVLGPRFLSTDRNVMPMSSFPLMYPKTKLVKYEPSCVLIKSI